MDTSGRERHATGIAARGGAHRQRAVAARHPGQLDAVVRHLVDEFEAGIPLPAA